MKQLVLWAHPVLSMGQPLSSFSVQLKHKSECIYVCVCAQLRVSEFGTEWGVYSRRRAVGVARQTVSGSVAVFPHGVLILHHAARTTIQAELAILEVPTLGAMFGTLETKRDEGKLNCIILHSNHTTTTYKEEFGVNWRIWNTIYIWHFNLDFLPARGRMWSHWGVGTVRDR